MRFDELGNGYGIAQNGDGLFEGFEVIWVDENGRRGSVSGDDDAFVMSLDSFDELRESISDRPERLTRHGHNCATRGGRMEVVHPESAIEPDE